MNQNRGFLTFYIFLILLFPVRIFQILYDVDKESGALKTDGITGVIIPLTLLTTVILYLVFWLRSKPMKTLKFPIQSKIFGFTSLLAGALIVTEGVMNYKNSVSSLKEALYSGENAERLISNLSIVQAVLGVFAAVYFIEIFIISISRDSKSYPGAFLSIAVPLWAIVRLSNNYIILTNVTNYSERLYDLLVLCGITVFLMINVRLFSNLTKEKSSKSLYKYGFLTVLLTVLFIVPRYCVIYYSDMNVVSSPHISNVLNLSIALYIFTLLFIVNKRRIKSRRLEIDFKKELAQREDIVKPYSQLINASNESMPDDE